MATPSVLAQWFPDHTLKARALPSSTPAFFRNLEEVMDTRRAERSVFLVRSGEPAPGSIDFSSLDYLSLSKSGLIRQIYLEELASHPDFDFSSSGSRLLNGNMPYTEATEREIAAYYKSDTALIFHSGFEANVAIMTAVARSGDAIVFDEFVHASMHEGMQASLAPVKVSFVHNDVESFRETLEGVLDTNPLIKEGKKNVLVCVESVYSMDGDTAPVHELLRVMKEICPKGNVQLFLDEAHSAGLCGENGRGFANMLGVENEIALRMYSSGKALASNGAVVVCNQTIREILINYARHFQYSTGPCFPLVAGMRSGYKLLMSGQTQILQERLQQVIKYFLRKITSHPIWDEATDEGILSMPMADDFESKSFLAPVIPLATRHRYTHFLCYHVQLKGINVFPIDYPVVPRGKSRLRVTIHVGNTEEEVDTFVDAICGFAQEMLDMEQSGSKSAMKMPTAARQVQAARLV